MARGLKFFIKEVEVLCYPSSENKGEAHLHLCFRICKTLVFSRRGSFIDTFYLYFEVCLGTKVLQIKNSGRHFCLLKFLCNGVVKKKKKKKTLAVRQLQGMLRIAVKRFLLLTVAQESAAKCFEALALCNVPQVSPEGCRRLL